MKTIDEYKAALEWRLAGAGLESSDLANELRYSETADELLSLLKMHMTQWVLDFKVTGAELESLFGQKRLSEYGIYTGNRQVTINEAYSVYAFGQASIVQRGDYCVAHFFEHSSGEIMDGKGRFYHQSTGKAYDGSLIFAHHEANVTAFDQAQLTLMDQAKGELYQQSSGIATGHGTLYCHDSSFGFLTGNSMGWFLHNSMGQCEGNSQFLARHAADVEAYGQCTGFAREKATISLADKAKLSLGPDFEGVIHQSNRTPIEQMTEAECSKFIGVKAPRKQGLGL